MDEGQTFVLNMGLENNLLFINGFLADSNKDTFDAITDSIFEQTPSLQVCIESLVSEPRSNFFLCRALSNRVGSTMAPISTNCWLILQKI